MWFANTWQTPDLTRSQIILHDFTPIPFGLVIAEIQRGRRGLSETFRWNFLRNCEWNWVWYSVIILRFLRTWPKPSMLLQNLVRQSSCLSLSRPVTPVKLKTWINDLHAGDGERQDENERQRDRGSKATKVIQDWDLQVQGFCSWCLAAPVTQVPEAFRPPISQVLVRSMKATCGFCGFTRSDLFLQPALERRPQILLQGMYNSLTKSGLEQNDLTCFSRCSFLNCNQARVTSTGVPFAKRHIRLHLCLSCQVCTWYLNHFETHWLVPISSGLRHPICSDVVHRIEALRSLQSELGIWNWPAKADPKMHQTHNDKHTTAYDDTIWSSHIMSYLVHLSATRQTWYRENTGDTVYFS